jgi:D-3-phosphoglycerate dehydrogenase
MPIRVLVCDPIHKDGISMLRDSGFEVEENLTLTPDQLEKGIGQFDAVVVRGRTKVTTAVLNAGGKLKVVARSGVGLDNVDLEAARKKSIKVISTPAAPTASVAELTIGLILALLRKISYADRAMKQGKWVKSELMGSELRSKTLGVIGAAGRIGSEVARIAVQGFGTKVMGYDVIEFAGRAKQIGFTAVADLPSLLRNSDIVTIHVPYMQATHHLLNEKMIAEMKNGALVINPSRGDVIDGQALLTNLKSGKLGGAGLDVFHKEPPIDDWEKELAGLSNVVCTPHIGAQTVECQRLESTQVAEQLIQALR